MLFLINLELQETTNKKEISANKAKMIRMVRRFQMSIEMNSFRILSKESSKIVLFALMTLQCIH